MNLYIDTTKDSQEPKSSILQYYKHWSLVGCQFEIHSIV